MSESNGKAQLVRSTNDGPRAALAVRALPSKIGTQHHERLAVVYVRQSTYQQVVRHQESTRLQYGLHGYATNLGWPDDRILVIDDDLGKSGATAEGRPGFQRLVAEVGLNHVGIILGIEMSRLARSCKDWHQLLEVCAIFGTLIADQDGIYDPSQYNDRLLLGLKGTMSEAELHVLKQRMLQGKLAKARRGELGTLLPTGYVRRPSGEIVKDMDEQVQSVIKTIFSQFMAIGTVDGVLRYLVANGIQFPVRATTGTNKGDVTWRRPNRMTLINMLHHPMYAGSYVFGRRRIDPRRKRPGKPWTGRTSTPEAQWHAFLRDHVPAYITWEQYEANKAQLASNRAFAKGIVRRGHAMLSGLIVCGRCGYRMSPSMATKYVRYTCHRERTDYAGPACQSLTGSQLDALVTDLVMQALAPAALEVSMKVTNDIEAAHHRLDQVWKQRLERAQYQAERALRQYNVVEPENRLVARTVERALEEKLAEQRKLEDEYRRFQSSRASRLTDEDLASIRSLAEDIPSLWVSPTTTNGDRQTILRQLVDAVIVTVHGESEKVTAEIHWIGGNKTKSDFIRPVARISQLSTHQELTNRILELRRSGLKSAEIADKLNAEGWRPPKRRTTFNGAMVRLFASRGGHSKRTSIEELRSSHAVAPQEWTLSDLAHELDMPPVTLFSWLKKGWVTGRRLENARRTWVIPADREELARLRAVRAAPKRGWRSGKWVPSA
jgi:DNA invertase Pin-like site-specific DNA recombinase